MKHQSVRLIVGVMLVMFAGACATSFEPVPAFSPVDVNADGYALKVQNTVVVLDTSSSMAEGSGQYKKFDIATATVRNLIQTIPENLEINSALRTFGHHEKFSPEDTVAIRKMGDFDSASMTSALSTVTQSGGPSPLCTAIRAAADDLNGLDGKSALIIVTDGKDLGQAPSIAATALKDKYKDSLCIYPILVGNDPEGKAQMEKLAQIGGCGVMVNADDINSGQQMAEYVSNIFVGDALDSDGDGVIDAMDKCPGTPAGTEVDATGCVKDSDGDGVADAMDKCPGTPAGITVDDYGCALDSDGDGVSDALDKCPGTAAGKKVDASGCPYTVLKSDAISWTFDEISFEVGKADLSPKSYPVLDKIAGALEARPELMVVVEGHTDNTGSRRGNMNLSQRRAQAVVDYLVGKGISSSRLSAKGYGPDRPIADNGTKLGRSKNRRVQFTKVE
ncbi:putative outer membrane protein, OmpA/MotB domain [Desulfosarcina variabilis str. Montpellier]|uniref:OmpA family protein n=1 Tax=Desulfosarcina variabilis TaxID=2300 RepID=UPI003AFB2236